MHARATVPKYYDDIIINTPNMALHDMQYLSKYTWIDVGMRTITSEQLDSGFLVSKALVIIGPLIRDANGRLNSGNCVTPWTPSEESKEFFPDWDNVPGLILTALPLRHFHPESKDSNDRIFINVIVAVHGFLGTLTWLDFNLLVPGKGQHPNCVPCEQLHGQSKGSGNIRRGRKAVTPKVNLSLGRVRHKVASSLRLAFTSFRQLVTE
ncbi:uncharacterized protein Bfra_010584 [Botrytis fragariae]|uniref:Uncharacterized protein n=1 Tax=Botrytis fragariae TaxID=1964551 RepID=A0A8H6AH79_9HELO|nr:uncharacterized protein Bfra_010584 [Botrytis fragariae]KAF5867609.1 hypothetical protein Bfra_010584 [Botrytis fragariae]